MFFKNIFLLKVIKYLLSSKRQYPIFLKTIRCINQNKSGKINYLKTKNTQFFSHQLVEYLLSQTTSNIVTANTDKADRIIRIKELIDMVGLSRTTIWRMENYGSFPKRVSLGANSVGWKLSEINQWLENK